MRKKSLKWIKSISYPRSKHSAFTDLIEFNGKLFSCFREATTHVSGDGKIKVARLSFEGEVEYTSSLELPMTDIRDPKLSITPDYKLLLTAYARKVDSNNVTQYAQAMCWFSSDGLSWSSPTCFGDINWWLWRVTWYQGQAYGFAYNRGEQKLKLYKGDPRRSFHCINPEVLSLNKHGLAYPNESDIVFIDDTAYALIRRDEGSCSAQLGISKTPFTNWKWHDLKHYIGGPAMIASDDASALAAGRLWLKDSRPVTALYSINLQDRTMHPFQTLPSAGDSSYPGIVQDGDDTYISYYSSHQDNTSKVFLAKLTQDVKQG